MLYAFFWVIPRRLNFIYRLFWTLSVPSTSHLPAYEDGTECSETSAYKIQTPGNYPEESEFHQTCAFRHPSWLHTLSFIRECLHVSSPYLSVRKHARCSVWVNVTSWNWNYVFSVLNCTYHMTLKSGCFSTVSDIHCSFHVARIRPFFITDIPPEDIQGCW